MGWRGFANRGEPRNCWFVNHTNEGNGSIAIEVPFPMARLKWRTIVLVGQLGDAGFTFGNSYAAQRLDSALNRVRSQETQGIFPILREAGFRVQYVVQLSGNYVHKTLR